MGTSIIDGTVEAVWLKRRRSKVAVYDKILFRLADGRTRSIGKSVVGPAVADRLVPGTSGRFYLYTAIDHHGLHGLRDREGRAVYAFPTVNETAMLILACLNALWLILSIVLADRVPLLPLFLTVCAFPGWFLYRQTRVQAQRQFDGDTGYAASASVASAGMADEPVHA
jgi:hypothetical protein